mmetsp:Transcript_25603/g.72045  ORF Transcript_25603/g.72045 Transcript_25603/m.72045 type:complete len:299 (+) Transcript_25603:1139-2035(+)
MASCALALGLLWAAVSRAQRRLEQADVCARADLMHLMWTRALLCASILRRQTLSQQLAATRSPWSTRGGLFQPLILRAIVRHVAMRVQAARIHTAPVTRSSAALTTRKETLPSLLVIQEPLPSLRTRRSSIAPELRVKVPANLTKRCARPRLPLPVKGRLHDENRKLNARDRKTRGLVQILRRTRTPQLRGFVVCRAHGGGSDGQHSQRKPQRWPPKAMRLTSDGPPLPALLCAKNSRRHRCVTRRFAIQHLGHQKRQYATAPHRLAQRHAPSHRHQGSLPKFQLPTSVVARRASSRQ